jgi:carboxyl-terminal processing protease
MDIRSAMKVPRYRWFLWAAFLAAALFFVFQMRILPGGAQVQAPKGFELLDSLMRLIRNDYLEERSPVETAEGAYRGLVNSLDPLSAYLDKELTAKYAGRDGSTLDPGLIVLKRYASFPQVVGVVKDSYADKADIKPGDLLSAVESRNSLSMSLAEVNLLLKGQDERPVRVRVLRGNETRDLELRRGLYAPKAWQVEADPSGRFGLIRVDRIVPGLASGLRTELAGPAGDKKKPFILDLRNCHEGDLWEALDLANLFVKAADAGRLEKKGGVKRPVACPAEPVAAQNPLVVWVNPGTMGPAELAAGLLQEVRRAKVVGFATPGLVGRTEFVPLKDETSILLTAEVYVLPSGKKLWDAGVKPDVALPIDKLDDKTYREKTLPLLPKL